MEWPLVLANGDTYDSLIKVTGDDGVYLLKTVPFVNTDSTTNYNGGRLASGEYYAIKGPHGTANPYTALWLFKTDNPSTIKSHNDVTDEMQLLPSEIPNPNHNGDKVISYVHIHMGGLSWDYSHGCQTVCSNENLKDNWTPFIGLFGENEVVKVRLTTAC